MLVVRAFISLPVCVATVCGYLAEKLSVILCVWQGSETDRLGYECHLLSLAYRVFLPHPFSLGFKPSHSSSALISSAEIFFLMLTLSSGKLFCHSVLYTRTHNLDVLGGEKQITKLIFSLTAKTNQKQVDQCSTHQRK